MKRLLYLGLAFPPGVAGHFPELQPAGHLIETYLIDSVRPWFEIRSVCITELDLDHLQLPPDNSVGLPSSLNLLERPPELFHRLASLGRLKKKYREWIASGWVPDVIMVCNFNAVYNAFILWLRKQKSAPPLVLYVADSMGLGQKVRWSKRLRHSLKPLVYSHDRMARCYDACVSVSRTTAQFIKPLGIPWLWLPNGCDAHRAIHSGSDAPLTGSVRFGFFGFLSPHTGIHGLIKMWIANNWKNELRICGFGKARKELEDLCTSHPQISFCGPLKPDECLRFARECDVLVNPRPLCVGNDNNFSSKVFEYALTGRAILTSRVSGVDLILGDDALYFDEHNFDPSLRAAIENAIKMPREELQRRGAALQHRMLTDFAWSTQGRKLADFLNGVTRKNGS